MFFEPHHLPYGYLRIYTQTLSDVHVCPISDAMMDLTEVGGSGEALGQKASCHVVIGGIRSELLEDLTLHLNISAGLSCSVMWE